MCFTEYKKGCTTCWLNKTMVLMGHEGCVQNISRGSGYFNTQAYFLPLWLDYKTSPCWPKPAPNENRGLECWLQVRQQHWPPVWSAGLRALATGAAALAVLPQTAEPGSGQADPQPCSAPFRPGWPPTYPPLPPWSQRVPLAAQAAMAQGGWPPELPGPLQPAAPLRGSQLHPEQPCQPHGPPHTATASHRSGTGTATAPRASSLPFTATGEGAQQAAARQQ